MESNTLITGLPDHEAASRFLGELADRHPADHARLEKKHGLLSDVLTLAAFSPLLATALLQHPDHIWWLERKRRSSSGRSTEELLESFGRFSMVNSLASPQELFARFRRRELLRIFLRDIRRLAGIAEITEEISNVADAILGSALKLACNEMDRRYGMPQETSGNAKTVGATVCLVALGKLGSRELNYSSDIDLLFLYSSEGQTAGGERGAITNREYFVKLAEQVVKLIGGSTGDGAAYRVDLRLRPHGRLGALAISIADAVRYHRNEARAWERQVMIRSRGCVGDQKLFRSFFSQIEGSVFSKDESVESALASVRESKESIDREAGATRGFNVKIGRGGIREIEFIAQALQLAHGGRDRWLRSPHTLISLARLADRGHISERELTELSSAYDFLRHVEHVLQMENGLQIHVVPDDAAKRELFAARIEFASGGTLDRDLDRHTANVSRIFSRIFREPPEPKPARVVAGARFGITRHSSGGVVGLNDLARDLSPRLAAMFDANPGVIAEVRDVAEKSYGDLLLGAVTEAGPLRSRLAVLRRVWSQLLLEIVVFDLRKQITIAEAKRRQTALAEAALAAALEIVCVELAKKHGREVGHLHLAALALGKLGGRGVDYDSDLDLLFVYDENRELDLGDIGQTEFYARAVELLVTTLSSVTRDGALYRVDLRLRPYGGKGLTANPVHNFLDYMRDTAAVWELLAFVKLRAVGGDVALAARIENETRHIIHDRAHAIDPKRLAEETRETRFALEKQRSRTRRAGEIDIKYGEGGMLDVYFAVRYLQLRNNVPDEGVDRSTISMLERLREQGSLSAEAHADLAAAYEFLSILDHSVRLIAGRTTRISRSQARVLDAIAARMEMTSIDDLLGQLTLHRLGIRKWFDDIVR